MKESVEQNTRHGGREDELLSSREKPHNALEQEILLAAELFERDKGKVLVYDHETKNRVMEYWNNHGHASVFRDVLNHAGFKEHPRFQNNPLAVTLPDVEYYLQHRQLPE